MENVMLAAFLCYCLLITAVTEGQQAGNLEIENCKDGFIDIRENANNTILCSGFDLRDTLVWTFTRNDREITVARCGFSYCTVNQSDHFAVQWSPPHSTLFYQQYDREVDKGATVTCASWLGSSNTSKTCTVNVINPATLSSCTVKEDRDGGTVRGSCRFDHAYSFTRGFLCSWYQEKVGESRRFTGTISSTSGSEDKSGWCTFALTQKDWIAGTYTYTINFYPGPGNITVNVVKIDTNRPISTRGTTQATSSPAVFILTTKDSVDYTSPKTQAENDLPMGAIVGGIVAVLAVIIVVVVVVIFVRRKRKQKPAGSAHGSSNENATDNDDVEEHVTPMYFTSDGPDASQENDENTYEKPARRPPNAEPEHVYNVSNTAATTSTTTTTTPSKYMETTTGHLHNTATNQHRGQGKNLDNVHHNHVYVNENQSGEESSGVHQYPTYANDHPQTPQGDVYDNRDSNPYYSEIKDTGIN